MTNKLNPKFDDEQQANFIQLILKLIEIQNQQIALASDFFLNSLGYLSLNHGLQKYLINTYQLNTKLMRETSQINQKQVDVDTIYRLTTNYTNEYYNNIYILKSLSENCENSKIKIEQDFNKFFLVLSSHDNVDFNIAESVYQIKRNLQTKINLETQKLSRINKFKN